MQTGSAVAWKWAGGIAQGTVAEMHNHSVEIVSKGVRVVRHGSADDPAVIINHSGGHQVLKLAHELQVTD